MNPSAVTPSVGRSAESAASAETFVDDLRIEQAHCPTCARSVPVEAPLCLDGHGRDCPERVCTRCGAALLVHVTLALVDTPTVASAARRATARRAA